MILPDEVFGEFDDVVLLDEAVVVAIKLSTGKEWWETEGRVGGGGETSLDVEEELSAGGGTATLMCLKTFCHMVA